MKHTTKTVGLAAFLIFSLMMIDLASIFYTTAQTRRLESVGTMIQDLDTDLGYGGLIHSFKNAVLRPDNPDYIEEAAESGRRALEGIERLKAEASDLGLTGDPAAMEETRTMVETYIANLAVVADGHDRGLLPIEIDRLVQVDDAPAEQEIDAFRTRIMDELNARIAFANFGAGLLLVLTAAAVIGYILRLNRRRVALMVERMRLLENISELKRFASAAAHDLQTPAAQVVSITDLLLDDDGTSDTDRRKFLTILQDISENMLAQTASLLEYAQNSEQTIEKSSFRMKDLVTRVAEDMRAQMGGKDTVIIEDMPDVPADPALMQRVWTNLVANAIKYVKPGTPAQVVIKGWKEDDSVVYVVEDKGIGIDPDHAETVFEPMKRLHGDGTYAGYGIGLSLVKSIVERHQGAVGLDAQYREGARFRISLPLQ